MNNPSDSIIKWVTQNQGYSFFTAQAPRIEYYTDAFGINRAMTFSGITDMQRLKDYEDWRRIQSEVFPEITFSKDYSKFKINLIEKEYER